MLVSLLALLILAGIISLPLVEGRYLRRREQMQLEQSSVTPEQLYALMRSSGRILVIDVRRPLDLLADSQIIRGSRRIPPQDLYANPELVPRNRDVVFYCTCPGEESSRRAMRRVRERGLSRVKFLKGGLAAWKAAGLPVEEYDRSFHLENAS